MCTKRRRCRTLLVQGFLAAHGVRVLRLRNAEVLGDCERALLEIAWALGTEVHPAAPRESTTNPPSPDRSEVDKTRVGRGLLRAPDAARGEGKKR